jgi:lipopolysaccharide/colanic/teichoic acid biosynthesis glycosyltransferase
MLDILVSLVLLALYPITAFLVLHPLNFLKNIFSVLFSFKSWVGFTPHSDHPAGKLPEIKQGILNPTDAFRNAHIPEETMIRLDILYARDYKLANDLNIILKGIRNLGRM